MKPFELGRLNVRLGLKVLYAYIAIKVLKTKGGKHEKYIAYFNQLIRLNLHHISDAGKYYKVKSSEFGFFFLRKPFSSDYKVFQQVFIDEEYKALCELAHKYVHNECVNILDGGANIGLVTIFLHQQLDNRGVRLKSILVEPFRDNAVIAKLNCHLQGLQNFFIEEAGLFNKSCYLRIDHSFRDGMEWSIQVIESNEPENLKAIEILDLLAKYDIEELDILKLDIEGAEKYLFADEDYASSFLKRTKIIAIEIHNEYISASSIVSILEKNDFEVSRHGELHIGLRKNLKRTG